MLIAMLPDQISNAWPLIKGHIEDSLPPTGDYGPYDTNNILYNLMFGNAQLWLYANKDQVNQGFVVTTIHNDISGVRWLFVYCVIIIDKEAKVDWQAEFETLKKFAHSRGCSKMGAYIMNQKLLDILKENDVETRFVFANINL